MNLDKCKKRLLLMGLVGVLLIVFISVICITCFNKKTSYEPMKLKFESRIDKLDSFDAGDYYKFGWLQVQGTNMDLPILSSYSDDYNDSINYSYGWMSINYVTGENRPVIMGHNILNVSNEPMLPNKTLQDFEELMAFTYYGFAKDNLYIQYTHDGKDEIYLIYAVGFYNSGVDSAESYSDKAEVKKYINDVKKNSIYNYDISVNEDDELLTLKTCTRYFGNFEKEQFMIDARKLRDGEDIVKYQVKTNKNFKDLNLKKEKT